jgi:ubiquinone/menaquinone biosynthesis C-methylase UbiE
MNWHDTIEYIRNEPKYESLVKETYIDKDLTENVQAFLKSDEFTETLTFLKDNKILPGSKVLDVGAGNGISSLSFALSGYSVTALEPDMSDTVGAGAIEWLKSYYGLTNLDIITSFGEEMPFEDNTFDLVYARQVMHHAYDLPQFAKSMFRVVNQGKFLLTVRDHVISNEQEKEKFLQFHPLHKYYGGENAFKLDEYTGALQNAGFIVKQTLGPVDSIINLSPWSKDRLKNILKNKFGSLLTISPILDLGWYLNKLRLKKLPGRLYSILSQKP